jgi:hypothetical protein
VEYVVYESWCPVPVLVQLRRIAVRAETVGISFGLPEPTVRTKVRFRETILRGNGFEVEDFGRRKRGKGGMGIRVKIVYKG